MANRKSLYNVSTGNYCGVLMPGHVMKKYEKLRYKQNQEIAELLEKHIDELYVSNWTLAYPNGNQEALYYTEQSPWDSVQGRIDLFRKDAKVEHVMAYDCGRDEAIEEHMKRFDNKES